MSNGTLNSYASLGITPYTYTIFQGTDTLMLNMTGSFDSLASGSYELYVTDSANCFTSSPFVIDVTPAPLVELLDTSLCDLSFSVSNVESYTGSLWSASSSNILFDNNTSMNPSFIATEPGEYTISFEDTLCGVEESFQIIFIPDPFTEIRDTMLCEGARHMLYKRLLNLKIFRIYGIMEARKHS